MKGNSQISERDLMKSIVITVTIKRDWRCALGALIMRLGAWVSGCSIKVGKEHGEGNQ